MKLFMGHLHENNAFRVDLQKKQYAFYSGDKTEIAIYLANDLKGVFSDHSKMPNTFLNITKRIVDSLAIVYLEPALRKVVIDGKVDKELTTYYNDILPEDVNYQDKIAHRMAKLSNVSIPQLSFKDGRFQQITNPSYLIDVFTDSNNKPIEVAYQKYIMTKTDNYELVDITYTGDTFRIIDGNSNVVSTKENPFGVLPFLTFRMSYSPDFWGEGLDLLVNENAVINLMLTKMNYHDLILGTSGILFGTSLGKISTMDSEDGTKQLKIGRDALITAEPRPGDNNTPDMKYISMNSQIKAITDAIDWKIRTVAESYGLSPSSVISNTTQSGVSRNIMRVEQEEIRNNDISACRAYEKDRFELIKRMNNNLIDKGFMGSDALQIIPESAEVLVDFRETEQPQTAQDEWLDKTMRLKYNLTNVLDLMRDSNPDIDDEVLLEQLLQKNKDINDRLGITGGMMSPTQDNRIIK